ncbi:Mandelate racemase/muconate lactonizing enzyme [Neofusicoccum parvum]|uniref:Mandelate racemase/muconate lactonizing enzyme n=2 Tax=Neofusicoccum parvum TaxID=310453 RepID=A0ACB5S5H1_9PEZI|nr:putative mandelate racemase muconate lactonizing enzyme family protein [Neofusicoccum parvum UCRNP2]GME27985.1 Mandelate racemase/muconate lactonizing enzyme [Neofusicoccum parvum]GME54222.1 Mandelate racemase/muconate lactonizing enzyme [Neofusicoccum parvum]
MAPITNLEYFRVVPRWLFVKITDDAGNFGWGEATLEGHTEAIEGTLNEFKTRILGLDADDIEHIWQLIWRLGFYRGGPVFMSALSGIDIALWDLKGRRLGQPIHQLLGGKVRNKVSVYAWIGGNRPGDVEAAAKARKAQGFKAVKMNATEDMNWLDSPSVMESAVERLKTVKSLGMDAAMDFHGRVHKPMAKQLAKALEPHHPLFIEEPLLSEHPEGVKQISELTTCPIALGERLFNRWDVKRFLQACLQIGITTPNHVIQEMSQGIHYNTEAGDFDIHSYVVDASVFNVKDGYVDALTGPGLGIEINEELVRKVAQTSTPWPNGEFYGPDGSIREW